jgi:hypothetical protein
MHDRYIINKIIVGELNKQDFVYFLFFMSFLKRQECGREGREGMFLTITSFDNTKDR